MAEIEDNIDYRIDVSDKIPPFSRIPSEIRGKNPEYYEPAIIAIGPSHREDERGEMKIALQRMEFVKAEYLNDLCKRHPANKLETYREEIRKSGEKAMMSYSTISSTYKSKSDKDENTSKFLEMLLMDGCFIVEFMLKKEEERRKTEKQQKAAPEPYQQPKEGINLTAMTFQRRIMPMLRRDLLLFENQIPFFILETIFKHTNHNISREDGEGGVTILYLVLRYLSKGRIKVQEGTNFKSLLHISQYYQHSDPDPPDSSDVATYTFSDSFSFTEKVVIALLAVVFIWIWPFFYVSEKKKRKSSSKERMIPTATKLKQVGVRFEVSTTARYTSSLKVSFEDEGIMKIPKLIIDPDTISEYSNLLAFEQTRDDYNDKFTKLMMLMDSLVDTADDVDLLKNSKIIDSRLSSEEVASFFNDITSGLIFNPDKETSHLLKKINNFYNIPWKKWWATLKEDYFSSPWKIISFIVGLALLALTITETVLSHI